MNEYGFSQGLARNPTEAEFPGLWRGLVGLWAPGAGVQGAKLVDFSGRNPVGLLTNGPTWAPGRRGSAVALDGVDDFLDCGAGSALNPSAVTVMGWFRVDSLTNSYTALISRVVGAGAFYQMLVKSTGKLGYFARGTSVGASVDPGAQTVTAGVWFHAAMTYDGTGGLRGYVNGKTDASAAGLGALASNTANTVVGKDTVTAGRLLTGRFDDIRIYNRALSAQEIMQSYSGASPLVRRQSAVAYSLSTLTNYTLTASVGAFTETGNAASLLAAYALTGGTGAFSETGNAASLIAVRTLAGDTGAFAEAGNDAALVASRALSAVTGGFDETGSDAGLYLARVLQSTTGTFTESGNDAGLLVARALTADAGAFTQAGSDASLLIARALSGDAGSFAATGQDASFARSYVLVADTGSVAATGNSAALSYAAAGVLPAAPGSVSATGSDATFYVSRILTTSSGSVSISGADASPSVARRITCSSGLFTVTGSPIADRSSFAIGGFVTQSIIHGSLSGGIF